jgi:hypothetical protein
MFSYFNNVKEAGQISWDDAMPVPTMLLTDSEKDKIISYLKTEEQTKLAQLQTASQKKKQPSINGSKMLSIKNYCSKNFQEMSLVIFH